MTSTHMPFISVIMPVYNSAVFLREAIDSILNQTFRDFEFLIINDGSSDHSEQIILSYTDSRIVYIKNPKNLGLITTLNNAVKQARGTYIARMDGDDISLPERFEIQLSALKKDTDAQMVCSPLMAITPSGKERDQWPADLAATTSDQIRKTLPWENCIAHPSVMIEATLLKKYLFSTNQVASEDWDLWLRLSRDSVKIIKTKEVLLKYRIHNTSVTQLHNTSQSPQIKAAIVKLRFAYNSLKIFRINFFVLKTLFTLYKDLGYHVKSKVLPRFLKNLKWLFTINPFKAYAQFRNLKSILHEKNSRHFLFFPYSHIGGSEKVHSQIVHVVEEQEPFVFFTGLHNLTDHKSQFGKKAVVMSIAQALYHPFFSHASERLILQKINTTEHAFVFGSNNLFFLNLIVKLKKEVRVADLTHDFNYNSDKQFAINHLKNYLRCNARVFISNKTIAKTKQFYDDNFVDEAYYKRLRIIYNCVERPITPEARQWKSPYKIVYVGRDTAEKRVHIIVKLAQLCHAAQLPFEFTLVGEMQQATKAAAPSNTIFKGAILNPVELSEIYHASHFVMISSSSEGFPLSLAEGMIHGCVPLSTAVGDIPFHVTKDNGFLISATEELTVVSEFLKVLRGIIEQGFDLEQMSRQALYYANQTFDKTRFIEEYRSLFQLN